MGEPVWVFGNVDLGWSTGICCSIVSETGLDLCCAYNDFMLNNLYQWVTNIPTACTSKWQISILSATKWNVIYVFSLIVTTISSWKLLGVPI